MARIETAAPAPFNPLAWVVRILFSLIVPLITFIVLWQVFLFLRDSDAPKLVIAVLADRSRFERVAKSLIFLPMAISFVGAGIIWKFIYAYEPKGQEQIGLLNAAITGIGGDPVNWITAKPWNTFFLVIVFVWLQTGFAMVLLSAALKGVPVDLLEAARIDGANEIQIFFRVIIPTIFGTIITVTTTVVIGTLKVFDIVYVMASGGQYGTDVIANEQYKQFFTFGNYG